MGTFWLITIGKMKNEHKNAYDGEYKARVNIDFADYIDISEDTDRIISEYNEFIDDIEDFCVNEADLEAAELYEAIQLDESIDELLDLDETLATFVSSEFDFKILDKWDKTKKN